MDTQTQVDKVPARRWWALASVASAQFLAVVDAFIVNVAIPSIRIDLHAGAAEIQAVIAVYQIAYAALVITGGRLGDIVGRKRVFIAGVLGFTLASLWCGLSGSAPMLIFARAAQGGAAAMMVPQVLASIHTLFPDGARARAFTIFAVAIGLGAAVGFMLGGWLVTLNLAGLGWRSIFCVNVPVGIGIALAAGWLMPTMPRNIGTRLDLQGAVVLFVGLLGLIVPLMFGRELGWPWWMWIAVAAGSAVLVGFVHHQRRVERRGGMPLIDLALLEDRIFVAGMGATFCFFLGNLSFYFVLTLYIQNGLALLAVRRSTHGDAAGIRICRRFAAEWRAADRRLRRAGHRACGNGPAGRLGNAAYDRHADGAARRVRLRSGHGAGAAVQCGADPGATRPRRVRSRHLDHDAAGGEWHRSCAGGQRCTLQCRALMVTGGRCWPR